MVKETTSSLNTNQATTAASTSENEEQVISSIPGQHSIRCTTHSLQESQKSKLTKYSSFFTKLQEIMELLDEDLAMGGPGSHRLSISDSYDVVPLYFSAFGRMCPLAADFLDKCFKYLISQGLTIEFGKVVKPNGRK